MNSQTLNKALTNLPKVIILICLPLFAIQAQDEDTNKEDSSFMLLKEYEQPTLELSPNAIDRKKHKEAKKKAAKKDKPQKRKKNEFYGIRAKKIVLKKVTGRNVYIEKFYILPKYEAPSVYVQDKYYFDPKAKPTKRKIVKTSYSHPKYGIPLHGAYEKRVNGKILEKGIYYKGAKHGRWVSYLPNERDKRGMELRSKEKYDKGFPKHARITYYDAKRSKIKEVMPYNEDGDLEGTYLKFYKSGRLMEKGDYEKGEKVGRWTEYYDRVRASRRRIVEFPKHYWEEGEMKLISEW